MPDRADLSVVMPAYNEQDCIAEAIGDVIAHVFSVLPRAEMIVVDDGSTDETRARAEAAGAGDARVRVLSRPNGGHGQALISGLEAAEGDLLLLLDADRQIALDDFGAHLDLLRSEGLEAVWGVRKPRRDPAHRLVISWLMRVALRLFGGPCPDDPGVPYKLMRARLWQRCAPLLPEGCTIPSVLLAVMALRAAPGRVRQVRVRHMARHTGRTVLRWGRLARTCRAGLRDVMFLRDALRRLRDRTLD